jgi:hypothetical protein
MPLRDEDEDGVNLVVGKDIMVVRCPAGDGKFFGSLFSPSRINIADDANLHIGQTCQRP